MEMRMEMKASLCSSIICGNNLNGNINSDLSKNELSLIGVIIQKPGITLTEAAEILGVSKRTASRIFASLQEKGCVKREGSNKSGVWKVVK